MAIEN